MATLTDRPARATSREARPHIDALHPVLRVPTLPADVVAAYRPRAELLSRRIADRICQEVAGFADPALSTLVTRTIASAVALFVDGLAGAPIRGHGLSDYYRRLGRVEAQAGHDLDAMRAAHHIAIQETWAELEVVVMEFDLPATTHHDLAQAVMDYQRHLHEQAVAGFAEGRDSRAQLLAALLEGTPIDRLRQLATPCWPLPDLVAVATTEATATAVTAVSSINEVLGGVRNRRIVVAADAAIIEQVGLHIARHSPTAVAVSWGVAPDEVPHAFRWATRTLRLARQGDVAVPATRVVRCHDHRFELLQHADPVLSRQLAADVLAPLLAEKPAQRQALSETMLLWLQTRTSAPVMAAHLGVHEQTVRNRLNRIRNLFGEAVHDPDRTAELMQALESLRSSTRR